MFKTEVYIEGQRLDLFKDEKIRVVSSVQNIGDISRVFNDYSQSFTVPASKRNNAIFKHYYNASINSGFDARIRHDAHIELQGSPFRVGAIRLESVKKENNVPIHYKLTFFGLLINLKTAIGDDYLSALDLSTYDMVYSSANIITGLQTGFESEDYIFPLISTDKQWFYNSNISDVTNQERLANIAWNGSGDDHGMDWTTFRPALKLMRIIEAIETAYGITFSRDFLGTSPFDNLYMWLANSDSEEALKEYTIMTGYDQIAASQPQLGTFDETTGKANLNPTGSSFVSRIAFNTSSSDGVSYTIQLMNGNEVLEEQTGVGNLSCDVTITGGLDAGASLYGRVVTTAAKTITYSSLVILELSDDNLLWVIRNNPLTISGATIRAANFMPEIKTIDFLKSIMNMYNLTIVPITATSFTIETLDLWYAAGETYDISKYVSTAEETISRSKIYREISFKFQKAQTILANQFKQVNKVGYGSLETKLKNTNGTPLDGGKFEIELDFEQMVYEKLTDTDDNSELDLVYGLSLDKGLSETIPDAHLFYAFQKSVTSNPLSLVQDNGTKTQITGNVFMPSHVNSGTKNFSTVFGAEIDEHSGASINRSLFALYYQDYIADSFNSKRRKYDEKAKLPVWLLNKLKLNDKLIINGDRFLINQMTTDVTEHQVSFELLNDIYNLPTDVTVEDELTEAPDPIVGVSFSITANGSGADTRSGACALSANATKYMLTTPPMLGSFIYNEVALTNYYDGDNKYYKIAGGIVIRINNSGIVTDLHIC